MGPIAHPFFLFKLAVLLSIDLSSFASKATALASVLQDNIKMEEEVGFEPTTLLRVLVFKTNGISRAHPLFPMYKQNGGQGRIRTYGPFTVATLAVWLFNPLTHLSLEITIGL